MFSTHTSPHKNKNKYNLYNYMLLYFNKKSVTITIMN